jgi:signal transduction histidine kinase
MWLRRLTSLAGRLTLPRRTARRRLTLLYVALFVLSAVGLLAIAGSLAVGSSSRASSAPAGQADQPPQNALSQANARIQQLQGQLSTALSQAHTDAAHRLLVGSLVALGVMALVSVVLGLIVAGRVLRPLREMTATTRRISADNLHERLAMPGPRDELKDLADTIDELLERLEGSFAAQRRFVANASHELRTPLTLERTLLQVALADPNATVESLRATCEELLASGQDQERLLEGLLTLASSERGLERRELLDLSRIAEHVLSTARPEAERLSVHIEASLAPASTRGDRGLIERLVANLTDNAIRYNHPDGRIDIHTATDADRALLTVTNTGPAIASKDVDRLFEPFQRLGEDRTADDGGHGLGLSIARAIAAAHDAIITARPQPEGGLEVTVSFPGA